MTNKRYLNVFNKFLTKNETSIAVLNQRKNLIKRQVLVKKLIVQGVVQEHSKRTIAKEIRGLGLKTSDKYIRDIIDEISLKEYSGREATKLPLNVKPKPEKIYTSKMKTQFNVYAYVFDLYLYCFTKKKTAKKVKPSRQQKTKPIPRNKVVTRIGTMQYYTSKVGFALTHEKILTRAEVKQLALAFFLGEDMNTFSDDGFIGSSNSHDIDFTICEVQAFKYVQIQKI